MSSTDTQEAHFSSVAIFQEKRPKYSLVITRMTGISGITKIVLLLTSCIISMTSAGPGIRLIVNNQIETAIHKRALK